MFVRSTRFDHLLSALFVISMGACGNFGSCTACGASSPLPTGGLPGNQTIEGGAQIRVTPQGFTKLTSILPGILNTQFTQTPICVPGTTAGVNDPIFNTFTGIKYCEASATGCSPGCKVAVGLNNNGLGLSVTNTGTLNLNLSLNINTTIDLAAYIADASIGSCNLTVSSPNVGGNIDIAFGIQPTNGELDLHVADINNVSLNIDFSGCGIVATIAQTVTDIISDIESSFIGPLINDLLTPVVPTRWSRASCRTRSASRASTTSASYSPGSRPARRRCSRPAWCPAATCR